MRATRCSVFTLRRVHDIRSCLCGKSVKNSTTVHESCKVAATLDFFTESVAISLSTNCDLAIEYLGVRAIDSLDVRVATIVVRMMRKVATSRFSNLWLCHPSFARNASSNCLCRILSFFGIKELILSSLFLSKTCENFS